MKIVTWNVERLRNRNKKAGIAELCAQVAADILVLTETDMQLNPDYKTCLQTLPPTDASFYRSTERRVCLFAEYDMVRKHETFDDATAVCAEFMTERGALIVYGVVIGICGNRHDNFRHDLPCILADIDRLAVERKPLCVLGDFNCSFSDNYYFTKDGRAALEDAFLRNDLELLTWNQAACIDHIAISQSFIKGATVRVHEWNCDKRLSDHKGICVELL